jgi:predicted acyl esterase
MAVVRALGVVTASRRPDPADQRATGRHYDESRLSQPTFSARVESNVRVPMRDGVTLSTDIYRPDSSGRFPTILVRTPYSNNSVTAIREGHYQSIFYAQRGYAVVQQDVRGRYDSDGVFYTFRREADDGYDTDEWIGRQPWSDGRIGTMGQSYCGLTQLLQTAKGSKYLTSIVPNATTFDTYDNWIYKAGAFQLGFALPWAVYVDGRTNQELSTSQCATVFRHLPISTADQAAGRTISFYRDWVAHPTRDAYWDENSWEHAQDQVGVPSFSISGWYDIFLKGLLIVHVEIIKRARTSLARTGRRLMVGPWVHAIGRNPVGEADFGPEAFVDLSRVQLRWYDPADPVPTLGGNNCCWTDIVPMGPFDQHAAEQRNDVLVYTSPELQEPMEITGPITVALYAATNAKDTDWTAKLVDVAPDGYARNLQDGIVRARYRDSTAEPGPSMQQPCPWDLNDCSASPLIVTPSRGETRARSGSASRSPCRDFCQGLLANRVKGVFHEEDQCNIRCDGDGGELPVRRRALGRFAPSGGRLRIGNGCRAVSDRGSQLPERARMATGWPVSRRPGASGCRGSG